MYRAEPDLYGIHQMCRSLLPAQVTSHCRGTDSTGCALVWDVDSTVILLHDIPVWGMNILGDEGDPYPWHGVHAKSPQNLHMTVTTTE